MTNQSDSNLDPGDDPPPPDLDHFQCRRCGNCCTGTGFVNLEAGECEHIAEFLGLPLRVFLARYTRHSPGYHRWLIDGEGEDEPCVFLKRKADGIASCLIDEVKPQQCRDFPSKWFRNDANVWCAGLWKFPKK